MENQPTSQTISAFINSVAKRAWDTASRRHPELATGLLVTLLVGLVALLLLPPGRLPYPPGAQFSDVTLAHWPNTFFLRQSVWRDGQWPLWRPTTLLGAPFAANPLAKAWYPPQWPVLLPGPSITLSLNLLVYAHLMFAALGMLTWARADGLSRWAGAFAALAYGLTPKVIAHLGAGHLDFVYAMAWAPWLLWTLRRFAGTTSLRSGILPGVIAALIALADMRLAAYALGVGIVYAISLRWPLRSAALAFLIFSLLLAVYIAPLLALGPMLTRSTITPSEAAAFSLPPGHLLGLLVADTGGQHEWMTYLGLPVLVLAALALRLRQRAVFVFWGIALLSALYALGSNTPFYTTLVQTVPLMAWLRIPSRAWFMVALSASCLSAYGAQSVLDIKPGRIANLATVGMAAMGLLLAVSALILHLPTLTGLGLALLGTGVALMLSTWQKPGPYWSLAALGMVLLISLTTLAATLVEGRRESDVFAPNTPTLGATGRIYSPSFTVLPHEAERAGLLTLHGVEPFQLLWSTATINSVAGASGEGYSITTPRLPPDSDPSNGLLNAQPDTSTLAALGVSRVISEFPIEAEGLRPLRPQDGQPFAYDVIDARPLAYLVEPEGDASLSTNTLILPVPRRGRPACLPWAHTQVRPYHPSFSLCLNLDDMRTVDGAAEIKTLTPNRVEVKVQSDNEALLVITQAWAPGWHAFVDGQRTNVIRTGGVVQGIRVAAGTQQVVMVYRPASDFIGLAISAGTALGLLGYGLIIWRASK